MKPITKITWLALLAIALFFAYKPLTSYFNTSLKSADDSTSRAGPTTTMPVKFISYWFSWAQQSPEFILRQLCEVPDGLNIVMIAFALEKPDNSGLTLQMQSTKSLAKDVQELQSRSIKVILSTGGADGVYPWLVKSLSDETIAKQYLKFVQEYHFDGIDFDVEKGGLSRLPAIIQLIKASMPELMITLTIGSEGNGGISSEHNELAQTLYSKNHLNFINLMNYDQYNVGRSLSCSYESLTPSENCYVKNIEATKNQINSWLHSEARAKQLISNGIMIGYADDKKLVNADLVRVLVNWLKQNEYGAVMTWGLNRDQASCAAENNLDFTTGMEGMPIGLFTNAIINELSN